MTEANRKLRVFLCHSSNDKLIVRDLFRRLDAEGWIDAWLDTEKLYPGQDWNFEIEKAVEEADVILVCITNDSVTKEGYVQRELRMVLDFADYKPEGTLFVIPVRLEECDTPRRLRKWQYADYFPENDRDRAYQRLLVSLRMRAKRLELSTEFVLKEMEEKKRLNDIQRELEGVKHRLERKEIEINAVLEQANEKIEYERNKNIKMEEERLQRLAEENALRTQEEKDGKDKEEQARKDKQVRDKKNVEGRARKTAENKATEVRARIESDKQAVKDKKVREGRTTKVWQKTQVEKHIESPVSAGKPSQPGKSIVRSATVGGIGLLALICVIFGANYIIQNVTAKDTPTPTDLPIIDTSTRLPPPSGPLLIGSSTISLKDHMSLMYVPEGEFIMGSDNGGNDEKPIHKVTLDAFWIDQTEVTNAMYAKCVQDGKCIPPSSIKSPTRNSYFGNTEYDNYPVIYVDWNMAKTYCEWAGRRLPTEAEWEKAARGTDGNLYPWGNDAPNNNILNYNNSVGDTTVVIKYYSKGNSVYGALDMAGNVWEWVNDWYDVYPDGDPSISSDFGQKYRALRGGSWSDHVSDVRSANRLWNYPTDVSNNVGFRCASPP